MSARGPAVSTPRVLLVKGRVPRVSPLRIAAWTASIVAAVLALAFVAEAVGSLTNALQRSAFPYAALQFSEGPLILQLQRMAEGQPAYLSTLDLNSYVLGPVYLQILAAWNGLARGTIDVASDRLVTMAIGLLGVVPLVFSAVFIARRTASRTSVRTTNRIAAIIAATLGLAVLPRAMTFDAIHSDDLLFTLVATMFACYNAAAACTTKARYAAILGLAGALACFTQIQAAAIGPVLILTLAVTGAISLRALLAGLAAYAAAFVVAFGLEGSDGRAWSVLVPLAQPWDFSWSRIAEALGLILRWHPYLGVLLASTAVALTFIWKRERLRALVSDALPVLMVLATAGAGFFYRGGLKNSLFLIGVLCIPYFAAMIAALATPRVLALRDFAALALAACGVLLGLTSVWALRVPPRAVPADYVAIAMANAQDAASALCNRHVRIVVLALPDFFAACPSASFALGQDFLELANAFPNYYIGPTVFDRKSDVPYAVTVNSLPLPAAWMPDYRLIKTLPIFLGYDESFFPGAMQIFKHT